jgi:hypothetical protein
MASTKKSAAARSAARPAPARKTVQATKPVAQAPAKPLKAEVKPAKATKPKKPKLVRDSFTIPKIEYTVLDDLKLRAAKAGAPAKKSEVLRAGIKALAAMGDAAFLAAIRSVPAIKTGRPAQA